MFFRDIIGQGALKAKLIRSATDGRISHAQLFAGPEGSGKLALALAYAQYLSCTDKHDDESCGKCLSCIKYGKLVHPDLHFVFPVVKTPKYKDPVSDNFIKEWRDMTLANPYFNLQDWFDFIGVENAQGLIYAHESEEIIRKLSLKPFESSYKVMIIWMPEKMHAACANKLLKMIEEPPSKTLFMLITEDEEEIIATIRSRCQLIKIPAIEHDEMLETLKEHPGIENMNLDNLVHLSRGNYRKATELLNPSDDERFNLGNFKELMRLAYGRKFIDLFKWVDNIASIGRERQKSFIRYALLQVRENFVYNLRKPQIVYLDEEETDFSSRFSPFINERNIVGLTEELEKTFLHIAMNGNPRITFTDMALRVVKLIRL